MCRALAPTRPESLDAERSPAHTRAPDRTLPAIVSAQARETSVHANGLRFSALEQGSGPVVLCLHGFPDNLRSFREQLPALADAGYRAVSPALRGYDPDTQPADAEILDYHPVRVAEDVAAWAEELGAPVHLVGHDWGAIVAYLVAAGRPELLRSLTTIAVPHSAALRSRGALTLLPRQLRNSWYVLFFQLRGIADRRLARDDFALIERLWRAWSPGFEPDAAEMEAVKATFRQPGVVKAALAYYRAMLASGSPQGREMDALVAQPIRVPTLAITGADDGCMDTRFFDRVPAQAFAAELRTERIDGTGHFCHQEHPDAVNTLLLEWLARHEG